MGFGGMLIRVEGIKLLEGGFRIEKCGMLRLCGGLSCVGVVRSHSVVVSLYVSIAIAIRPEKGYTYHRP